MQQPETFFDWLKLSLPFYVTNKTAGGLIMSYSMNVWLIILAMFLVMANLLLWGGIGIWKAFEVIF